MDADRSGTTAGAPGRRREIVRVAPGVRVATAQPWSTTTTVVVAPDGACLVVDPALTPADLDALAAVVDARGWRVEAGVSTHPHWDHVLWSASLGDVPRWATAAAVEHADRTRDALLREADDVAPGHDPALVARLRALPGDDVPWSGPRVAVVRHDAHCPGSAALVLPDAGVLLAGDLLSDREVPLLDLDHADPVAAHRAALAALDEAARHWSVSVLVPGHGTPTDAAGLAARLTADRAYLSALDAAARRVTATREGRDAAADPRLADPRLADPEQRAQHERQVEALRIRRRSGRVGP